MVVWEGVRPIGGGLVGRFGWWEYTYASKGSKSTKWVLSLLMDLVVAKSIVFAGVLSFKCGCGAEGPPGRCWRQGIF